MAKNSVIICLLILSLFFMGGCDTSSSQKEWAIVVHGGAGGNNDEIMPEQMQQIYQENIKVGMEIGSTMLANGESAVDAVQAVIVYMENCPLFNAGKGAVMTSEYTHELDAAIMDGSNLNAGAVAGLKDVKNPIKAARAVMDYSPHVLLMGEGASFFAREQGLEIVDNSYFSTPESEIERERIKARKEGLPMGTVGCVALDKGGNLAAATSTGGMSGKKWGRVGDVPIIGAGTYADNETVAVSGTGHGEFWIRRVVGYDVSALMKYSHKSLEEAAHEVIWDKINPMQGCSGGGIICVDKYGNIAMEFNTPLMFRAWSDSSGESGTAIYK